MTKTFKTILGLILAWALVAQAGVAIAQSPNITSMHTAATATGNGTALVVSGPAGNPANTIGAAGIQIANSAGTFTITFETLTSGSTWTAVMATNMTDDVRDTTATAAGQYTILLGGAVQLRARISACSSCSVTVVGRLIPGLVARVASSGGGGGGGSGDVVGPASATDNAIARFNLATGKLIQNSVVTIADSTGDMAGVGTVNTHTIPGGTDTFTLLSATQTLSNKTFVAPALGTPASGVATNLTGTAASLTAGAATVLATARTINGTSFDGSANITVTAAAGTLTGATLAAGVTASSLTSFGTSPTITTPTISGAITFPDDVLQTFNPGTTNAGLNVGSLAGDPSTPSNGSLWYDSTANELTARINGANVALGAGGGGGITIGTTTITSGTTTRVLYNNAGVVGEYPVVGSGNAVLSASPTLTGIVPVTSTVTTGTGTSSGFSVAADSLTTGAGANFASSSVTSGSVVNIASTSTAAASSTLKGLNIAISGANGTTGQTVTGATIAVTNTNATSGTNNALTLTASGATTANNALNVTAGQIIATTGTITTSQPAIDLAQTWNNAATIFTGLKFNITSTASNSGSLIADFQIGGSSVIKLTRGGSVNITDPGFSEYSFRTSGNAPFRADAAGVAMTANKLNLSNSYVVAFSSTANWFDTADLFYRRSAAANLAFGAADAAAPVAQTMSVQNVVAGTSNTAGANWTHIASRGTGTGVGGDYIVQVAPAGGSGTAQNTLVNAFTVKGNGAVQLLSVTFANLPTVANGYLIYCSDCTIASPCASGGSGALAKGINSAWVCN